MKDTQVKELIEVIKSMAINATTGYGMSFASFKSYLEPLTRILNLKNNKEWQALCFQFEDKHAQEYLNLSKEDLLEYNGMSIKNWDTKDLTRKYILKAIDAKFHSLSTSAIQKIARLKNKLIDKDFIKLAIKNPMVCQDYKYSAYTLPNVGYLLCIKKPTKVLSKQLKTFNDWINYFTPVYFFMDIHNYRADEYFKSFKILNAPKAVFDYLNTLYDWYKRFMANNTETPLSLDETENETFNTYLKMKGIQLHKPLETTPRQYIYEHLLALHECLIAKYNSTLTN